MDLEATAQALVTETALPEQVAATETVEAEPDGGAGGNPVSDGRHGQISSRQPHVYRNRSVRAAMKKCKGRKK